MPVNDFSHLPARNDVATAKQRFEWCAEQGLFKHAVPESFGGYGNQFYDLIMTHRRLGNAAIDTGLILAINAHLWGAVFPLLRHGSQQQQQTYLAALVSGTLIGAHAITEPHTGSDLNAISSKAEACEQGYLLSGRKRYITNSSWADICIVYAQFERDISAFIVSRQDSGVTFCNEPSVSACRTATMGDIVLENCILSSDRLLGKPGAGKLLIQQALELERAFIFAGICGIMEWQLQQVINFSRNRIVNSQHLGKNQAISHRIAEMKLKLDSSWLWIEQCAHLADNNKRLTLASAEAKLFCSEAFLQNSLDAVQLFGASGLLVESGLSELVSDALASRLFSGTSEIQKNIIAALCGTGDGYSSPKNR